MYTTWFQSSFKHHLPPRAPVFSPNKIPSSLWSLDLKIPLRQAFTHAVPAKLVHLWFTPAHHLRVSLTFASSTKASCLFQKERRLSISLVFPRQCLCLHVWWANLCVVILCASVSLTRPWMISWGLYYSFLSSPWSSGPRGQWSCKDPDKGPLVKMEE